MVNTELALRYGVLAKPISEQLIEQGFNLDKKDLERFDNYKRYLNVLYMSGFITEAELDKILKRLHKYITAIVKKYIKKNML